MNIFAPKLEILQIINQVIARLILFHRLKNSWKMSLQNKHANEGQWLVFSIFDLWHLPEVNNNK